MEALISFSSIYIFITVVSELVQYNNQSWARLMLLPVVFPKGYASADYWKMSFNSRGAEPIVICDGSSS